MPAAASAARALAWRNILASSVDHMSGRLKSRIEDRSLEALAIASRAAVLAFISLDILSSSAVCRLAAFVPMGRRSNRRPARGDLPAPNALPAPSAPLRSSSSRSTTSTYSDTAGTCVRSACNASRSTAAVPDICRLVIVLAVSVAALITGEATNNSPSRPSPLVVPPHHHPAWHPLLHVVVIALVRRSGCPVNTTLVGLDRCIDGLAFSVCKGPQNHRRLVRVASQVHLLHGQPGGCKSAYPLLGLVHHLLHRAHRPRHIVRTSRHRLVVRL
ncbi:hypothetical protein I4F81_003068 [Pyropia yezoensis]|uniref:Uncharacterized protein n=1 Tax=Pyropia yezoensis TaxID=2788 RepID=A0ACC3BR47_PYRYE|nr:hypothetical protein I4F81_003068 [Neopyropia yezoensis]